MSLAGPVHGIGVDVLLLKRFDAVVARHGPGLSVQLGVGEDVLWTGQGALKFCLVECAVKATPGATLFSMMEALRGTPVEVMPGVTTLAQLPWTGGTVGRLGPAWWCSGEVDGHLVTVLGAWPLAVEVAVAPVTSDASVQARALLNQLAGGEAVVALPETAPTVGGRPASLAHDGTLVAAAVLRQDVAHG